MKNIRRFITIALALFLFSLYPQFSLAQSTERALVKIEVDLSRHSSQEKARLWLPYPVSDRFQTIRDVKVQGTYHHYAVYTDKEFGNPILYAQWMPGESDRHLTLSFVVERVERMERISKDPGDTCIDKRYFSQYLASSSLLSLNRAVIDRARGITEGKKTPLQKAKAIYEWVTSHMERDPTTKGCGRGDVCYLLFKKPSGKCADISSVFVALLRAAGIPAREVFGLRLSNQEGTQEITMWQHCWSEFYLPGYGWVVADPADYLKFIVKKGLKPCSKEAKELRGYYFGAVDPNRVRFAIGRDIILNPSQKAGPLNYFMYPYAEIGNRPLDYLSPKKFSYNIKCITLK